MAKVTTCEIVNESDKKSFTLYVEWLDSLFKVMLIKVKEKPLVGQMETKHISFFSEELGTTNSEYIEKAKEAFSGKNAEIQFFITNDSFEWRQKNVWTLGRINLQATSSIDFLSETLQNILKFYYEIYTRLEMLEDENKTLKAMTAKLTTSIEEMTKIKLAMEQDLYQKFLLVLNEKKQKIRELKQKLEQGNPGKKRVFDVATDESSNSDEEVVKNHTPSTEKSQAGKRKLDDTERTPKSAKSPCKAQDHNLEIQESLSAIREKSPEASTSKCIVNEESNSFHESNSSPECPKLYLTDDESDDDMFNE